MPESPDLDQALERARTSTPPGSGPGRTTLGLAGAVLVGTGFLGGYLVGGHTGDEAAGPGGMVMRAGGPGGGPGGMTRPANLTIGTIKSISGNTVTLKSDTGDTVKVKITGDTTVRVTKEGSVKDLSKGDNIVVDGQRDGDTVTADNVNSGGLFRRQRDGGPNGG
jgi:hypothetical protein